MLFGGPKIVPIARRKVNVLSVDPFRNDRRDEKIPAEKELMILTIKALRIGILKKERLHQWDASPRGFLHGGVNKRKQSVAQLDVSLANRFLFGAACPGLVIGCALRRVVAINRIEHAQFIPARQEIDWRRARESADVCSNERVTGKPEAHDLRNAHAD